MLELEKSQIPEKITILPVFRDVLLPGGVIKIPLNHVTGEHFKRHDLKVVGLIPTEVEDPKLQELKEGDIGTVGTLLSLTTSSLAGYSFIVVLGQKRFIVKKVLESKPLVTAEITLHQDTYDNIDGDILVVLKKLKQVVYPIISRSGLMPVRYSTFVKRMVDKMPLPALFDLFFALSPTTFEEKLEILNELDIASRIAKGIPILMQSYGFLNVDRGDIRSRLTSPPAAIIRLPKATGGRGETAKELFEAEDSDMADLSRKIQNANLPEHASKVVLKELGRLKRMGHFHPNHAVLRNYLEFVAELPWSVSSKEAIDLNKAREELEIDHYGMSKLKKRILEYLAVCQLKPDLPGPILCFYGPPGVGKTSIGRSIARILSKNFQRISLGGVSNQSEIRGHRRTYIGALPGRILQALKQAGTNNPVILLDEIDKLGQGVMGNPTDALLEVLDPEQNAHFTDHYLGLPFDLSRVTFIATANSLKGIPLPLADRMEIIHVSGYTPNEKFHIATRHLVVKQMERHGLSPDSLQFTDDAIHSIIREYTREAGVRSLERKLAAVCRHAALKVAASTSEKSSILIDKDDLEEILGVPLYVDDELCGLPLKPGVALGLCWTPTGGSLLTVEVTRIPGTGTGKLILTGCLGNVIKESAQIALNWVRSVGLQYGLVSEASELLLDGDLHIHFPAGAVSKEGPSAGITIATAIISLLSGVALAPGLAMTGELTLQGRVLPIGGLKEKLAAAGRVGVKKVILPSKCKKDLSEVPESILSGLEIVLVENMVDVIQAAFDGLVMVRDTPSTSLLSSKL